MKPGLSVLTLGVQDLDRSLAEMEQARRGGATIVEEAAETFYGGYAVYFEDLDDFLWEIIWNPAFLPADGEGRS
jgi:hypothetical protein